MAFLGSPGAGGAGGMAGHSPSRMKRKDLEDVYDEFSEFSLSSPAKKIRRLDAELPPIMEEEGPAIPLVFGQQLPEEQLKSSTGQLAAGMVKKGGSFLPLNDERALVLYKPVNSSLLESPSSSNVVFKVDSDLIAGFKNQAFWSDQPNRVKMGEEEAEAEAEAAVDERAKLAANNNCLAVVPWMPYQLPEATDGLRRISGSTNELWEEPMEFEEVEVSSSMMDVEEKGQPREAASTGMGGLQHWQQQQHCIMTQQFSPNPSTTPIMWSG